MPRKALATTLAGATVRAGRRLAHARHSTRCAEGNIGAHEASDAHICGREGAPAGGGTGESTLQHRRTRPGLSEP